MSNKLQLKNNYIYQIIKQKLKETYDWKDM
jgi:hypothetical protein